jgi:hypothetical protein
MTAVSSAASHKQSTRRLPGFLLSPFGWAAEPLAAMVSAEPTVLADLFEMSQRRMHLIALGFALPRTRRVAIKLSRGAGRRELDAGHGQRPPSTDEVAGRPLNSPQERVAGGRAGLQQLSPTAYVAVPSPDMGARTTAYGVPAEALARISLPLPDQEEQVASVGLLGRVVARLRRHSA